MDNTEPTRLNTLKPCYSQKEPTRFERDKPQYIPRVEEAEPRQAKPWLFVNEQIILSHRYDQKMLLHYLAVEDYSELFNPQRSEESFNAAF